MIRNTTYLLLLFLFISSRTLLAQISIGGEPLSSTEMLRSISNDGVIEMKTFDKAKLLREDSIAGHNSRALRFANKFKTDIRPENSGVRFTLADGTHVWQVKIRSKGAYSINLLFTMFHLPEGAKLYIYNSDRTHKIGAFTSINNNSYNQLPTAPVYGEEIVVEYQEPASAKFKGSLAIGEVNHDYRGLTLRARPGQLYSSQTCHQDAACFSEFDEISRAVTLLIVNGTEFCTGCMLNNAEQDGTPYLLSAAHCFAPKSGVPAQTRAQNTIVFFNYRSPSCRTSIIGTEEMSLAATDLLLWEQSLDIALLKLKDIPPAWYRPYYAGWNTNTPASSKYTAIHHPMSKTQKIANTESPLQLVTFSGTDGTFTMESNVHWRVARWLNGTTEGGSSGSPLFDANKRLIGTLTGGASYCTSPYDDYYAALSKNYNFYATPERQLKKWLDPKERGVREINGYNPYTTNYCERLSNVERRDSVGVSRFVSPLSGPIFGHNSTQSTEFAEKFICEKSSLVYGIYMIMPQWKSTMNGKFEVRIYSGETKPEKLLYSQNVQLSYLNFSSGSFSSVVKPNTRNAESYIQFSNPISVDKSFFVSYTIQYQATDTIALLNVISRNTSLNTAYLRTATSQWIAAPEASQSAPQTSLWIDPVVSWTDTSTTNKQTESGLKLYYSQSSHQLYLKGLILGESGNLTVYNSSGRTIWKGYVFADGIIEIPKIGQGYYVARLQTSEGITRLRFVRY